MPDITVRTGSMTFENPFVIASGPPGTNRQMIAKAFKEGWGGVVAKTVSLECDKVNNVAPRYAKLKSREKGEVIGFQNIELISDRPIEIWEEEFRQLKAEFPEKMLIASIMEEYEEWRWREITQRCDAAGVDGFELNLSCPHGLPERGMGGAMGQNTEMVENVCRWASSSTSKPVWAKMTPNITDIRVPAAAAIRGGASGISAINTILSVTGVDLKTLRPYPTVEGYSLPGGYSCQAVRPIALRMVSELGRSLPREVTISGMGGVECSSDAIQFILLGSHTVQVCTAAMLQGFGMVKELIAGLEKFMEEHGFATLDDFRGHSLQYLTTHKDLVERQVQARRERAGQSARDNEWDGDKITRQSEALTSNTDTPASAKP
ncbi:MAG: NAD-dependent dihydropyrimidine dehydrogenase subunit PreA [Candidatus Sumerlaeia bacterium]|nr:NAD-dependent dihydropyrimidine dehydrogenase subunit PreA [Candidatus Sumerlaeia bacterium]